MWRRPDRSVGEGRESYVLQMYNYVMRRTTIVAPEELLDRLRAIAREEDTSFADIVRQGLEWRASHPGKRLRFIGAGRSQEPHDTARQAGDIDFTPRSWR
jgi:hypothetical protein